MINLHEYMVTLLLRISYRLIEFFLNIKVEEDLVFLNENVQQHGAWFDFVIYQVVRLFLL